jgi:hypothetical protein
MIREKNSRSTRTRTGVVPDIETIRCVNVDNNTIKVNERRVKNRLRKLQKSCVSTFPCLGNFSLAFLLILRASPFFVQ